MKQIIETVMKTPLYLGVAASLCASGCATTESKPLYSSYIDFITNFNGQTSYAACACVPGRGTEAEERALLSALDSVVKQAVIEDTRLLGVENAIQDVRFRRERRGGFKFNTCAYLDVPFSPNSRHRK